MSVEATSDQMAGVSKTPRTPQRLREWIRWMNLTTDRDMQRASESMTNTTAFESLAENVQRIHNTQSTTAAHTITMEQVYAMQLRTSVFVEIHEIHKMLLELTGKEATADKAVSSTEAFHNTFIELCHLLDYNGFSTPSAVDMESNGAWKSRIHPTRFVVQDQDKGNGTTVQVRHIVPADIQNPADNINGTGMMLYPPDHIFNKACDTIFASLVNNAGVVSIQISTLSAITNAYFEKYDEREQYRMSLVVSKKVTQESAESLGPGVVLPRMAKQVIRSCINRLETLRNIYTQSLRSTPPYIQAYLQQKHWQALERQRMQPISTPEEVLGPQTASLPDTRVHQNGMNPREGNNGWSFSSMLGLSKPPIGTGIELAPPGVEEEVVTKKKPRSRGERTASPSE